MATEAGGDGAFWTFAGILVTSLFGFAGKAWLDSKKPKPPYNGQSDMKLVLARLDNLKEGQDARAEDMRRIEDKIDRHVEFHLNHPQG